jgi:hypothetical protein
VTQARICIAQHVGESLVQSVHHGINAPIHRLAEAAKDPEFFPRTTLRQQQEEV